MAQETYLERIKKLKSEKKITNEKLADMTSIPLGTLSKLLAGISDSPKLVNMVAISQALGCSLDYLITGEPENTNNYTLEPAEITLVETFRALDTYGREMAVLVMEKEHNRVARQAAAEAERVHERARGRGRDAQRSSAVTPVAEERRETERVGGGTVLPVLQPRVTGDKSVSGASAVRGLGRRPIPMYEDMPVSAGAGVWLEDNPGTTIMIPDVDRTAEADFALRISGDSMEPKYHSGDILLVQECDTVEEGELGIFVLDGAGYFKKYGGDCLISLNPAYQPIMLKDFAEASCCGRVVGKLKRK